MKPLATRRDRKDRGLRRLMSRTKDGRDAARSSEAHPQARLIAPPSQGRVPAGRHSPKSAETGEAHSAPGANLRRMRRRRQALLADSCSHAQRCRQENGFFSTIDVKQTSADCDAGVAVGRRSGHCYVESFGCNTRSLQGSGYLLRLTSASADVALRRSRGVLGAGFLDFGNNQLNLGCRAVGSRHDLRGGGASARPEKD
jgi:hypothetical protein